MKYYNYYSNIIYFENNLIHWYIPHLCITNTFYITSFDEHTNIIDDFIDSKKKDLSYLYDFCIRIDYIELIKLIQSKKREIKLNKLLYGILPTE